MSPLRAGSASRPVACAIAAASILTWAPRASAAPRWNIGLESGMCWSGDTLALRRPGFCNAIHADVLLLRERDRDLGLGPSLRLGTAHFDDVRLDAGVSLLLPVLSSFPVVLEAGPHLRNFDQPGVFASAFFGLRGFNHYGRYDMATGLSVLVERSWVSGTPSAIWLTARIDGSWLVLPFLLAYNALR